MAVLLSRPLCVSLFWTGLPSHYLCVFTLYLHLGSPSTNSVTLCWDCQEKMFLEVGDSVVCVGQSVALVLADTFQHALAAARAVNVTYSAPKTAPVYTVAVSTLTFSLRSHYRMWALSPLLILFVG